MKTVRILGGSTLEVADLPEPEPHGRYVVIKVMASAIVGTERRTYEQGMGVAKSGVRENGGHEAAGIVWKAGPEASVREGQRVALFGAYRHCGRCAPCLSGRWLFCTDLSEPAQMAAYHSQFVLTRDDFCLPLLDEVDFESGALLTAAFGAALRAVRRLRLTARDSVLIAGQGPLGLAVTRLCAFMGASVIAADVNDYRLGCATTCGAQAVVNPSTGGLPAAVAAFAGEDGVKVAIDCSGSEAGRLACLNAVGRGGRVAFVGLGEGLHLDAEAATYVFLKEVELIGSWFCDPIDVLELMKLVVRGLDPGRTVTHKFEIERAAEAFVTSFGGESGKVMILPWAS
jgi:propanol-preferring alcohol dehydrogenase